MKLKWKQIEACCWIAFIGWIVWEAWLALLFLALVLCLWTGAYYLVSWAWGFNWRGWMEKKRTWGE